MLLFEDDPYGELSYGGEKLPSLLSMNPQAVIYTGSFLKLLSPGMRVGYVIAPEPIFRKLVQVKQAADLHTPSFTQRIVHHVIKDGFLEEHIPTIRALYAEQCRVMLAALAAHFPRSARWNAPEGGCSSGSRCRPALTRSARHREAHGDVARPRPASLHVDGERLEVHTIRGW